MRNVQMHLCRGAHSGEPNELALFDMSVGNRIFAQSSAFDRRSMLAAGLAAGGGLLLPGCSTARPASASAPLCLPKVKADKSRLIRAVAGLRPYRPQGFVVRRETIAAKQVVHNYGHGGAGITLSWGTSHLAVELGLPGHSGSVAVLGSGVMGLSTARLLQDAGYSVTIYSAALPPDTTSNIAGGQFHPFGHFRRDLVSAEWREQYRRAVDYSWRRFQLLVGDDYGVRWLPTYAEADGPEPQLLPTFPPINRVLERSEHPFPVERLIRYDTLYIEPGRYLRRLLAEFRTEGGSVQIRHFGSAASLAELPEQLIFNCTGLGSRELFDDADLMPIRGQLAILLPQPEVQYAFLGEAGYMFPRPDGIVLGGTYERGEENPQPEDADIERIIASHARLFGAWRCA